MAKRMTVNGAVPMEAQPDTEFNEPNFESGNVFKLTKPLNYGGEEVTELIFRGPTQEDICRVGFLYTTDKDGEMKMNPVVVREYIARLSGIPLPIIKQMSLHDFDLIRWWLAAFFDRS